MELDEFRAIARATVEECHAGNIRAMIGCTSTYTIGACRRAAYAGEIGADAIQVALPFWLEIGDAQIVPFVQQVVRASGGLPLSIYDTGRAKRILTLDQHRAIKDAVPQYLMVKSTAGTLGATPEGCAQLARFLSVFVGEARWAELGPLGAAGGCSSAVYWGPRFVLGLWEHVEAKDWNSLNAGCAKLDAPFQVSLRDLRQPWLHRQQLRPPRRDCQRVSQDELGPPRTVSAPNVRGCRSASLLLLRAFSRNAPGVIPIDLLNT